MEDFPVKPVTMYGKQWIFEPYSLIVQCAYCIYVQPLRPIRDTTGLVTHLRMVKDEESHNQDCPQNNTINPIDTPLG